MRRSLGWVVWLALATACATAPLDARPDAARPSDPLAAGLVALRARQYDEATEQLVEAARRYPALEDYTLYFRARAAARAGRRDTALELTNQLLAHPDSVWTPRSMLLAGELRRRAGDAAGAEPWLAAARSALPAGSAAWARATLGLAQLEAERGAAADALLLARELRQAKPRGVAGRRGRRLAERLRQAHPELPAEAPVDEAELRLREGDATGARRTAENALETDLAPGDRARALWTVAQAERAAGDRMGAEATCRTLAREVPTDPLAPRALVAAAGWRWNADDDAGALELFRESVRRFPDAPQSAEALYAIGRIAQEAGRADEAARTYGELAERFPNAPLAAEARFRTGWVRYLAGDFAIAAERFRRIAAESEGSARAAAAYWEARSLERVGRNKDAEERFAMLVERHPRSYYAVLAEERLGRAMELRDAPPPGPPTPFPSDLTGPHAERARLLAGLGFPRFARREVDALRVEGAPALSLLEGYRAVGANTAAIRLAREMPAEGDALAPYLYPLGYWEAVYPAARERNLDPLLVAALIRQESLYDPAAVSSANAHGLMQLLPSTARDVVRDTGAPPPSVEALHRPEVNVPLGVALLARLRDRYRGSLEKALAAYNAGEDAVAKWERRYVGREADEFVELISYRETRDYVKSVLGNYRTYQTLYAPSASATSRGSPPNAPFDMMTMTSPGRADATR